MGVEQYDEKFLFHLYVKERGNLSRVSRHDGAPKSLNTLRRYRDLYKWDDRKHLEDEKVRQSLEDERSAEQRDRVRKLKLLEGMLTSMLLPRKNETSGELEYILKPSNWESSVDKLLKIMEKVDLMEGHPTSRVEIRNVVEINVKVVCQFVGQTIEELLKNGFFTEAVAREFVRRFEERIKTTPLQLGMVDG